jgi:hypothetical protein
VCDEPEMVGTIEFEIQNIEQMRGCSLFYSGTGDLIRVTLRELIDMCVRTDVYSQVLLSPVLRR